MMARITIAVALVSCISLTPERALALTVNITLSVDLASSPGQVIYTVSLEDAEDGSPVSISGYTLSVSFDPAELSFAGSEQLVDFGAYGQLDFTTPNDCSNGRCMAGNILGVSSEPAGPLFAVTFAIVGAIDDGIEDFEAGILNPVFDDITQPTGDPVFEKGVAIVSHAFAPEPSAELLGVAAILNVVIVVRVKITARRRAK